MFVNPSIHFWIRKLVNCHFWTLLCSETITVTEIPWLGFLKGFVIEEKCESCKFRISHCTLATFPKIPGPLVSGFMTRKPTPVYRKSTVQKQSSTFSWNVARRANRGGVVHPHTFQWKWSLIRKLAFAGGPPQSNVYSFPNSWISEFTRQKTVFLPRTHEFVLTIPANLSFPLVKPEDLAPGPAISLLVSVIYSCGTFLRFVSTHLQNDRFDIPFNNLFS